MFSPPAWGWSGFRLVDCTDKAVLPTRVGMVLQSTRRECPNPCSPHPRGDGPSPSSPSSSSATFSPPAWGWSGHQPSDCPDARVLPTRVGMVRPSKRIGPLQPSSPHPRGDGPIPRDQAGPPSQFSPPAWGWSGECIVCCALLCVLPTRVGMVRFPDDHDARCRGSPHPRGDGPRRRVQMRLLPKFSPPAWGWSAFPSRSRIRFVVLPTRVGMVRAKVAICRLPRRSPHPRGDGPPNAGNSALTGTFSPPAWGWSAASWTESR